MAAFDDLPAELLILIQHAVDSPHDLHSLISASPACLRALTSDKINILTSVLRNAIPPDALLYLLMVSQVPAIPPGSPDASQEERSIAQNLVMSFLDKSFDIETDIPTDIPGLTSVLRLYALVSRFADEYFYHAARRMVVSQTALGQPTVEFPLRTRTEWTRLLRAFCLFELYCRMITPGGAYPVFPGARGQFAVFAQRLEPWVVEEMCCVHNYLTCLVSEAIDDLNEELVQAMLTVPGARQLSAMPRSDMGTRERYTHGMAAWGLLPNDSPAPLRRHPHIPPTIPVVTKDDRAGRPATTIYVNGRGFREIQTYDFCDDDVNYLISGGLRYVRDLITCDATKRRSLIRIRRRGFFGATYFPDALRESRAAPSSSSPSRAAVDDNDPSHANVGYRFFRRQGSRVYAGIYDDWNRLEYNPLREMGYVFWDSERIWSRGISESLGRARAVSEFEIERMSRRKLKTTRERLKEIWLPDEQRKRIHEYLGEDLTRSVLEPAWH